MKKMLAGKKFGTDAEVQSALRQWLVHPASFFASGIQQLVNRCDKCLNEFGRCGMLKNETWLILMFIHLSVFVVTFNIFNKERIQLKQI